MNETTNGILNVDGELKWTVDAPAKLLQKLQGNGIVDSERSNSLLETCSSVPVSFPRKLHDLLNDAEREGFEDIVSWHADGKSFKVHKVVDFSRKIMLKYFNQTKYKSFQRQLNLYGFSRVSRGPDKGLMLHEKFVRENRSLCLTMNRKSMKDKLSQLNDITTPKKVVSGRRELMRKKNPQLHHQHIDQVDKGLLRRESKQFVAGVNLHRLGEKSTRKEKDEVPWWTLMVPSTFFPLSDGRSTARDEDEVSIIPGDVMSEFEDLEDNDEIFSRFSPGANEMTASDGESSLSMPSNLIELLPMAAQKSAAGEACDYQFQTRELKSAKKLTTWACDLNIWEPYVQDTQSPVEYCLHSESMDNLT